MMFGLTEAQIAQFGGEATVIRYFPYFRDKANGHRGFFGLALAVATVAQQNESFS